MSVWACWAAGWTHWEEFDCRCNLAKSQKHRHTDFVTSSFCKRRALLFLKPVTCLNIFLVPTNNYRHLHMNGPEVFLKYGTGAGSIRHHSLLSVTSTIAAINTSSPSHYVTSSRKWDSTAGGVKMSALPQSVSLFLTLTRHKDDVILNLFMILKKTNTNKQTI